MHGYAARQHPGAGEPADVRIPQAGSVATMRTSSTTSVISGRPNATMSSSRATCRPRDAARAIVASGLPQARCEVVGPGLPFEVAIAFETGTSCWQHPPDAQIPKITLSPHALDCVCATRPHKEARPPGRRTLAAFWPGCGCGYRGRLAVRDGTSDAVPRAGGEVACCPHRLPPAPG